MVQSQQVTVQVIKVRYYKCHLVTTIQMAYVVPLYCCVRGTIESGALHVLVAFGILLVLFHLLYVA